MKNHILNKSMLSFATAVVLFTTGCGSSDSDNGATTPTNEATKVVGGIVNLNTSTSSNAPARKSMARANANATIECGDSAEVQLYAIDDTSYQMPLLTSPVVVQENCSFDITDENFKDATNAGADKQYIIRTIIKTGDKFVELSAAKLSEGTDVGAVDPIATMIKERFETVLEDVKTGMAKLEGLVSEDAITLALANIVKDFEKNFDTTVANLKADIDAGKVTVNSTLFETTEALDTQVTDEVIKAREVKAQEIAKTLQDSSVNAQFNVLDNSVKQQQLDSAVITKDTLKNGLTPALAELKYGVIESFAKIGLPVHDGMGNIIVSMPIEEERKGELPGKTFSITYIDENNATQSVGDDYTLRVVNPKSDLSNVRGQEDWYKKYLADMQTIIPASAIDSIMVNKDHLTTMQDLGKALSFGDNKDVFKDAGLYSITLSNDIDVSVGKIVDLFEDKLIENNYDMMLWEAVDGILGKADLSTKEQIEASITALKDLPFVVQDDENVTQFLARFKAIPEVSDYLVGTIGESLSSGIPLSADKGMLQFQDGVKITPDSKMKPLASLAMINLYMNAGSSDDMSGETITYKAESLDDMFGWMSESAINAFKGKEIWVPDYSFEDDTEPSSANEAPARKAISPQVEAETNIVISLVAATTGDKNIVVERTFYDTIEALSNARNVIEKKSMDGNFGFEDEFKGSMVDYGNEATISANVSLEIKDFNNDNVNIAELNATLIIAPIFTNIETGEWKTVLDKNITLSANGGRYSATSFNTFNPDPKFSFDENATVSKNGEYKATGEFDLILAKEDGTKIPLATFPIFPDSNDLDMPFYYDATMMGEFEGMSFDEPMMDGGMPSMGMFVEHNFIDAHDEHNGVFFPQITTIDGKDVGENLFAYDAENKKFTPTLDNGVLKGAQIEITKLFDSNEDMTEGEDKVNSIVLDTTVKEGAFFRLELKGSQIKPQTIMMSIVSLDQDGSVEYELFKEDSFKNDVKSDITFSTDMLDRPYYIATKTMDGKKFISTITFNSDGTRIVEVDGEEQSANYEIDKNGNLHIYDNSNLNVTIKIVPADVSEFNAVAALEGFNADGVKIFDRLVFDSVEARDAFISRGKISLEMIEGKTFYLATKNEDDSEYASKVVFHDDGTRSFYVDGQEKVANYEITSNGDLRVFNDTGLNVTMKTMLDDVDIDDFEIIAILEGFDKDGNKLFDRAVFETEAARDYFLEEMNKD